MDSKDISIDTLLAGLGGVSDPVTGGLVPPIHLGVTHGLGGEAALRGYARSGPPGGSALEAILARLEGGAAALAFTSGASAAQALLGLLAPGDHLVAEARGYYEFRAMLGRACARIGASLALVELADTAAVAAAIRPGVTRMIWSELPTNPTWALPDLPALAALAQAAGARLVCDATVATPYHAQPLALGADVVLHSATKFLNGHGDLTAGVLVLAQEAEAAALAALRTEAGTVLPPLHDWLLQRGLRTFALRMARASGTALMLARWLEAQPGVRRVHYPGLASHPQHDRARAQFRRGFGAMLSFECAGPAEAAAVVAAVRIFRPATSLGSTESLIEARRVTEGPGSLCPPGLLRLSIGLEDPEELQADLAQALGAL